MRQNLPLEVIVLIDLSTLSGYVLQLIEEHRSEVSLRDDEIYIAYKWCVAQAVDKILRRHNSSVFNHYRHDLYLCLYDHFGGRIEALLTHLFHANGIYFQPATTVDLLITSRSLILVKVLQT